jgi:hypothetical protein
MTHYIYGWNLENLFDIEKSLRRPEWVRKANRKSAYRMDIYSARPRDKQFVFGSEKTE